MLEIDDIKYFEKLYEKFGLDVKAVDYKTLVNAYDFMLSIFLYSAFDNELYHNARYIYYVVYGFHFFYDKLYGNKDLSMDALFIFSELYRDEIVKKLLKDDKTVLNTEDKILVSSLSVFNIIEEVKCVAMFNDFLKVLLNNAVVIEEKIRDRSGKERHGMEYFKHQN